MAHHRAGKPEVSRIDSAETAGLTRRHTNAPGKRKALKPSRHARTSTTDPVGPRHTSHAAGRKSLFPGMPSAASLIGAAALVIAAAGAVTVSQDGQADAAAGSLQQLSAQASVLTGSSGVAFTDPTNSRQRAVSRDSAREALQDAAADELQAAAEAQAKQRNAALAQLAASAEQHADEIAANAWVLPIAPGVYHLTGTFGESSSMWATTHTGLDFAAPSGTSIMSVANGVVTSTEYDGSYGNLTIITLEDGTEIWYGHQTSFLVSPGDAVRGGEVIGTVGSTGNTTGPHVHIEVRPGAGDPVDPYAALTVHGLSP